ncbi:MULTISPECIES: SGNH/GDSL hydrolase family protein [unclassified Pseudonocardia]|jgi:lysophospholipase L1-like esterase|uniref:SGNH/GDSL hydrolase family protein n=1 Tax=unclassified Pseudonocardia TaxID=2619320 RepID=UPI0009642F7C|nr:MULTISPECIES: SGNH/GDSL hydrolase family protein [unclassified Pseudonocardia]MBN9097109.1 SGNH hydrolase [Pseudonocardia sp.]OJY42199.1 MAG: hypothetical protein BGP03_10020 [Pseudonocardia sp. 73-21]
MRRRLGRVGGLLGIVAVVLVTGFGVRSDAGVDPRAISPAADTPSVRALRIMPLGSSSTVGAGSLGTAGFRWPLESLLARDGIAYDMVGSQQSGPAAMPDRDHEGHGGWTMARMQPLVAGWMARQRPDVVLLQVGTNDLITGVPPAVVAQRLDTMLRTIRSTSTAGVIVAGVWAPLRSRLPARAEYARLAAAVVARHRSAGEPVTFVDTSTLLGPGDVADGLHPSAAGYRKIAAIWEREIRSFVTIRH